MSHEPNRYSFGARDMELSEYGAYVLYFTYACDVAALREQVDRLNGEEWKAMAAMDHGIDDSRWVPGTTAVDSLVAERDSFRAQVAALREQVRQAAEWIDAVTLERDSACAQVAALREDIRKTAEVLDDCREDAATLRARVAALTEENQRLLERHHGYAAIKAERDKLAAALRDATDELADCEGHVGAYLWEKYNMAETIAGYRALLPAETPRDGAKGESV